MPIQRLLAGTLIVTALSGSPSAAQLRARVLDSVARAPLIDVPVHVVRAEATDTIRKATDESGFFVTGSIPAGRYAVIVRRVRQWQSPGGQPRWCVESVRQMPTPGGAGVDCEPVVLDWDGRIVPDIERTLRSLDLIQLESIEYVPPVGAAFGTGPMPRPSARSRYGRVDWAHTAPAVVEQVLPQFSASRRPRGSA